MIHADIHMLPVDDLSPEQCAELQNFAYWKRVQRACDAELASAGFDLEKPLSHILVDMAKNSLRGEGGDNIAEKYASDHLDWAMNIRQATEYDWATCLQLAEVFLYG
jgi:hypothetical protein